MSNSVHSQSQQQQRFEQGIQISQCLLLARRNWLPIVVLTILGAFIGHLAGKSPVPTYSARATLLIDAAKVKAIRESYAFDADRADIELQVASQLEMLRSATITNIVLDRLPPTVTHQLALEPVFGPRAMAASLLNDLGFFIKQMWPERAQAQAGQEIDANVRNAAGERLANGLRVYRRSRTHLLDISYTASDPVSAMMVANEYADALIAIEVTRQREDVSRAGQWLFEQISSLKAEWETAEAAAEKFKSEHNLVSAGGRLVGDQKLADTSTQLSTVRAEIRRLEARHQQITSAVSADRIDAALVETLTSPSLERARSAFLAAEQAKQQLQKRIGSSHEAARRAQEEMQQQEKAALAELARIADSILNEIAIGKSREQQLMTEYDKLVSADSVTRNTLIQLRDLERKSETYRLIYTSALQKHQEILQQKSLPLTQLRVFERAATPGNPDPSMSVKFLLFGAMFGLASGIAFAGAREISDNTVRTRRQVIQQSGVDSCIYVPLIASRKSARSSTSVSAMHASSSVVANQLLALKSSMDGRKNDATCRIAAFTGDIADSGASTLARSFAELTATLGYRTLLIESALKPESEHTDKPGLLEAIEHGQTTSEHLARTGTELLSILPLGNRVKWVPGIFGTTKFADFLSASSKDFNYIIVDIAPFSNSNDATTIAPLVDGFVIVLNWGQSKLPMLSETLEANPLVHEKCMSIVVNKTSPKLRRYDNMAVQTAA